MSRLKVRIYPATEWVPPFGVMIRTTLQRWHSAASEWTGVCVTSGVINHRLITDEIAPVYAPLRADWQSRLIEDKRQILIWHREQPQRLQLEE